MRCLLILVGLHAVMVMVNRDQKGKLAGYCLGGLCATCLLFRSRDTLMLHGFGGVRSFLESKGLGVLDIGTAIVVYEAMGFLLMCLFWFWCWVVQPVKTGLLTPFGALLPDDNGMVARAKSCYESIVEKMGCKFGWISNTIGLDPARLTASVSAAPPPITRTFRCWPAFSLQACTISWLPKKLALCVCDH
jgi:hypothetical protein